MTTSVLNDNEHALGQKIAGAFQKVTRCNNQIGTMSDREGNDLQ